MARDKARRGPERPESDAAKREIRDDVPGEARVRGPEERTPGEDVVGEDLRPDDELLGERTRPIDDVLAHAESEAVPDRLAEEQQGRQDVETARGVREVARGREQPESHGSGDLADVEEQPGFEGLREPEQAPAFGSLDEPDDRGPLARDVESGLEPTDAELREVDVREGAPATGDVDEGIVVPARHRERWGPAPFTDTDPEKVERAEAWEHAPDLEQASMILERGEGEAVSRAVSQPVDLAQFDPISSAAYDEPLADTMDLTVPGAGITAPTGSGGGRDIEPPPDSVREVQRPLEVAAEPNDAATRQRASTRHGRRATKKATTAEAKTKAKAKAKAKTTKTKKEKETKAKRETKAARPRRTSRRGSPKDSTETPKAEAP